MKTAKKTHWSILFTSRWFFDKTTKPLLSNKKQSNSYKSYFKIISLHEDQHLLNLSQKPNLSCIYNLLTKQTKLP